MDMAILMGMSMQVKNIKWLSIPAAEAEVEISDNEFTCVAFSCPCGVKVNQQLTEPLHVFDIRKAAQVDEGEPGIWRLNDTRFGQRVVAELIDPTTHLFRVGRILLIVDDYLPGGLAKRGLVEFECARIDLW
jgi:hypothetical protein